MLDKLFLQILNMSFTASFVIAIVLLARLLLKKAPKAFSYALWLVVLFRLVCPISFESVLSILPNNPNPIPGNIGMMAVPQINTGLALFNNAINPNLPAATPTGSVNPMQIWIFAGRVLWLIGIAGLLIYSVVTLFWLTKRLKSAVHYSENIYYSNQIETAFVLGIFRPKIYLPSNLGEAERNYILLHEQTHIRRFDHIIKPLGFFVLMLHWFNPLVWIAFFVCGKDMEMSCDEAVVKKLGNGVKKDYSTSLLSLATGRKIVGGTPLAFGEGNTKGRIKNVLNYKKPAIWVVAVAAIAAVLIGVGLMANPKDAPKGSAGINAIILEIDKDAPSMTVEGTDENSVIGDRCIITWEKDALITLATSSKPTKLSLDDFSVGSSVVLFIGAVQETYPTKATASSIQLQPNEAKELVALRPMVMINGNLYLDTGKEAPMEGAKEADGTIKTKVPPNKKSEEHEQSNFGFVGSEYIIDDGFIQVKIDGKWIIFELEEKDALIVEYAIAKPGKNGELSWGTATNAQLAEDVIMNGMMKSAAWEGVDIATLKEYYLIRQTFPKENEVHDYYAYRMPDGTAVLQRGTAGQYSVISDELYQSLEKNVSYNE